MIPELRPRGVGEMLDAAVRVYRTEFGRIIRRSILVVIPFQALSTLVLLSAQDERPVISNDTGTLGVRQSGAQIGAGYTVMFLFLVASLVLCAVTTRAAAAGYVGVEPAAPPRRPVALTGMVVLISVLTLVGFALCVIPGLILLTFWSVAIPCFILEGASARRSLSRSGSLVGTGFIRSMGVVTGGFALSLLLNVALSAAMNLWSVTGANHSAVIITQGIGDAIALSLTGPFLATVIAVLYFDLRIRAEGYDVQLLMQRNDARYREQLSAV